MSIVLKPQLSESPRVKTENTPMKKLREKAHSIDIMSLRNFKTSMLQIHPYYSEKTKATSTS